MKVERKQYAVIKESVRCRVVVIEVILPPGINQDVMECLEAGLRCMQEQNAAEVVGSFFVKTTFDKTADILNTRRVDYT